MERNLSDKWTRLFRTDSFYHSPNYQLNQPLWKERKGKIKIQLVQPVSIISPWKLDAATGKVQLLKARSRIRKHSETKEIETVSQKKRKLKARPAAS